MAGDIPDPERRRSPKRAKARGVKLGRKPTPAPHQQKEASDFEAGGMKKQTTSMTWVYTRSQPLRGWPNYKMRRGLLALMLVAVTAPAFATDSSPAILLVTWLVYDQPPSSYQTTFDLTAACQQAREKVLAENARLSALQRQRDAAMEAWTREHGGVYAPGIAPTVSASTVNQLWAS